MAISQFLNEIFGMARRFVNQFFPTSITCHRMSQNIFDVDESKKLYELSSSERTTTYFCPWPVNRKKDKLEGE